MERQKNSPLEEKTGHLARKTGLLYNVNRICGQESDAVAAALRRLENDTANSTFCLAVLYLKRYNEAEISGRKGTMLP